MTENRRKAIPKKIRALIALRQDGLCACGCGAKLMPGFHLDHEPALELREWDEVAQDMIPPANDPAHLFGKTPACHLKKTAHPRGRHTSIDSDMHAIAKVRRLRGENKPKPKREWYNRGFPPRGSRPMRGKS